MWPNPHFPADLVTFAEKILNGKLHFLCSIRVNNSKFIGIQKAKFSGYHFHINTNMLRDFQVWISVLLRLSILCFTINGMTINKIFSCKTKFYSGVYQKSRFWKRHWKFLEKSMRSKYTKRKTDFIRSYVFIDSRNIKAFALRYSVIEVLLTLGRLGEIPNGSRERVKPFLFVTFKIRISYIFPEVFIEIHEVAEKLWSFFFQFQRFFLNF